MDPRELRLTRTAACMGVSPGSIPPCGIWKESGMGSSKRRAANTFVCGGGESVCGRRVCGGGEWVCGGERRGWACGWWVVQSSVLPRSLALTNSQPPLSPAKCTRAKPCTDHAPGRVH